jgi:RNA-binding protein 5/10
LNQKKDYTPIVQGRNENSLSPPPIIPTRPEAIDIGFAMLEKKDRPLVALSLGSVPVASKLVAQYHSDSDENEDQAANKSSAAASTFNENDLIDFEKLTCMLCKRAFPSADVLNKHVKMSNLHKENLQKYKLQNGILDIASSNSNSNLK